MKIIEKKQFENDNFILYAPDSLEYITNKLPLILENKIEFYKKLFDIKKYRKIQINYFDDLDKFRNFIYELRGEKNSLPIYAKGTFDRGMINGFVDKNIAINTFLYSRKLYMVSHELFHIMYRELILSKNNLERVIWYDEGMAQLFSGENDIRLNNKNFKNWFSSCIKNTKTIPNLNLLSHGNKFENDEYSGYDLSLLSVKYLYETLSFKDFKKLMYDIRKIKIYGKNIVNYAIDYYENKYKD